MKTLLFTLEYPPFKGGVANYYENIVENWPEKNEIKVLNNNQNQLLKKWLYPHWIFSFWHLYQEFKKNKIEYILVGHILPLGTITYFFSKFFTIKYLVILHGMDIAYTCKNKRKKSIAEKILKKADKIICSNSFAKKFTEDNYPEIDKQKIKVINPAINIDVSVNENLEKELIKKYKNNNEFIIFSVCRLVKRKGIDQVIKVFKGIKKDYPSLKYLIAGTGGDEQYLRDLAGEEKDIVFLGKISDEEKWAYLSICDIFSMPSRNIEGDFEGFGIVYLEAGLMSKAVLAGDSGGVADAVIHNQTGLLVNPEDTNEIKNAIIKLMNDGDFRKKLGENAKKRIIENFQWKDKIKDFYKLIKSKK